MIGRPVAGAFSKSQFIEEVLFIPSPAPGGRFELPPPIRGPALKAGAVVHLATPAQVRNELRYFNFFLFKGNILKRACSFHLGIETLTRVRSLL